MPKKNSSDEQSLISEITEAFKGVEFEGGIGLNEANAIDDYKDAQFREECRKIDEKQHWNVIPSSVLNQFNSSLSFFDPKGMKFHLPAFMIAEIKGEYRFGMSFALTNLSEYSRSQFVLLTEKQREVVKLFLEFLLEHPDYEFEKPAIKEAIEGYWSIEN
ncbi:MAG: DUF6714 family protein [Bacteroidota bacterium]